MLPGIAAVVISGAVWLTPESPRYIMAKRGYQEGEAVLAQVRSGSVAEEAKQFTGMNMLIMYSNTVFTEMGFSDPFAPNTAFTGVQIVGMIVGLALLDSSRGSR